MGKETALHQMHLDNAAKLVEFSGYCLPMHYGSVIREHLAVRESAGMFDLSQISLLDVEGKHACRWLRVMLSNDVAKLQDGEGLYTCLCHEHGGVIDDLIVFRIDEQHYRLFIDEARLAKDLSWMTPHLTKGVKISQVSGKTIIAVQGPDAISSAAAALRAIGLPFKIAGLARFASVSAEGWFISRTGVTGEDGVEITVPSEKAVELWQALDEQFVIPAGLGARDTLRLEAGFGVYGYDINDQHTPAESGIASTIDISDEKRVFIGRDVLEDHKRFGGQYYQIGLTLEGRGLIRRGANVELVGESIGQITSGSYSPSREISVGLAKVSRTFTGSCDVEVRSQLQPARITSIPFVPHGVARE